MATSRGRRADEGAAPAADRPPRSPRSSTRCRASAARCATAAAAFVRLRSCLCQAADTLLLGGHVSTSTRNHSETEQRRTYHFLAKTARLHPRLVGRRQSRIRRRPSRTSTPPPPRRVFSGTVHRHRPGTHGREGAGRMTVRLRSRRRCSAAPPSSRSTLAAEDGGFNHDAQSSCVRRASKPDEGRWRPVRH